LPVPKPDMISDSQNWWNKADCCITVFRDFTKPDSPEVEIYVQKVRFKHVGKIGVAQLQYNKVTGRYIQPRFKGGYEDVRG
jgi:twinkle protein